jgi:hypothetical protein
MDSIRNPFFASAVATVDRVLAAQVTSIFSTQILNNLKPSDIGAAADTRRMIFWKNLNLTATSSPLYTVFPTPVDEYGNTFTPLPQFSYITDFGIRIKTIAGTKTTSLQLRIFKGGITIDAGTVGVESNRCSNSLTVDTSANTTSSTVFTPGSALSLGKSGIVAGTIPQLAVIVANVGNTILTGDVWAGYAVLPD